MTSVTADDLPAASLVLPHGPAGVGPARRRLGKELSGMGAPEAAVGDAELILSELLSNAFRHGRPLAGRPDPEVATETSGPFGGRAADAPSGGLGTIRAGWSVDAEGLLTLEVTDGGGPTRPRRPRPSLTAHGGRGLGIVAALALDWGVRESGGAVTVWAVLPVRARHARREGFPEREAFQPFPGLEDLL